MNRERKAGPNYPWDRLSPYYRSIKNGVEPKAWEMHRPETHDREIPASIPYLYMAACVKKLAVLPRQGAS